MNKRDSIEKVHYDREEFIDMCKCYELKGVSVILIPAHQSRNPILSRFQSFFL